MDGSPVGVLVDADARNVVFRQDAHVTGLASRFGNLVANKAAPGQSAGGRRYPGDA